MDQQVSIAELVIDPIDSDDIQTVALTPADKQANTWQATVTIEEPAVYKVRLVSEETGFENTFAPRHEIRPVPDLIPRAGFVNQQETTLLVPPNDILALQGMAEDDLPVASLHQHVSINGDEWLVLPLEYQSVGGTEGRQLTTAWEWDLAHHRLKTGDQVLTKLVATDRKGSIGESVPLRLVVAAREFDPQRHTMMERKLSLQKHMADFSVSLNQHKTSALEVIDRLREPGNPANQRQSDRAALADLAHKQRELASKLLKQIQDVEREMAPGADAHELDLAGRLVARTEREHASTILWLVQTIPSSSDGDQHSKALDELKRTFERTADDAKQLHDQYQYLAAFNFLNSLASDLDAMLRHQQMIVHHPTQTWQRLQRHETIILNQLRALERLIHTHRTDLPTSLESPMTRLLQWSESVRDRLTYAMESDDKIEELKATAVYVLEQLQQQQRIDTADGGIPNRQQHTWRDFDQRSGSLYVPIEQAGRAAEQENRLVMQATQAVDSLQGKQLLEQAERFAFEIDLKHRISIDQLRARRQLTQLRRDSDSQYAADAGLTVRAATSLLNQHRTGPIAESEIPQQILEIAPAYRTLEAGHDLILAQNVVNQLLEMERWQSQSLQSHIDHPRQWDLTQRLLETASQHLKEARVAGELVGPVDQLRWSAAARDAGRKIGERRWKRDHMISASHELEQIQTSLAEIVERLHPVMEDARATIAKYSPTISQMAEQTSAEVRRLEEQTIQVADQTEVATEDRQDATSSDADATLAQLQQEQQQINQQIQDLVDALIDDANRQDLLETEQRERARDADDSIALIQQPAIRMNQIMQDALQNPSSAERVNELAQASEQQELTAQALDLVARHFQQLNQGQDVADSRQQLRLSEQQTGIARKMAEQYDSVQQLEEQISQSPDQLIQELEAELQQNPAMQQALSEISRNAIQEARNALEYAANDDQNIQRTNERSDQAFQDRKRELATQLREVGQEASRLSTMLVAQAIQSAAMGQSAQAREHFTETQKLLNEAASKANSARDDTLLADLNQTAVEARDAIEKATESLKLAQQQTVKEQDSAIHKDDATRAAQQKDLESRRQRFLDQQKRTANDLARRADDAKRRSEQSVKNAENELRKAEQRIEQVQKSLEKKPDDTNLKTQLVQAQNHRDTTQEEVNKAEDELSAARQKAQERHDHADAVASKKQPPLSAPNPAIQLADHYAAEALDDAERILNAASGIADATDFQKDLNPAASQLASAKQQQSEITEDVQAASDDVARAARHERRLNNQPAVQPLLETAAQIARVAQNESKNAEKQLDIASNEATANDQKAAMKQDATTLDATSKTQPSDDAGEFDPGKTDSESNAVATNPDDAHPVSPGRTNAQALLAQKELATAEQAFLQQSGHLDQILQPLLADAAETQQDQTEKLAQGAQPASQQSVGGGPADNSPQSSASQPVDSQAAEQSFTPDELARGQQLARTLDELDRLQASQQAAPGAATEASPTPASRVNAMTQEAQARQAELAAARNQMQQQAVAAMRNPAQQSADGFSEPPAGTDFDVTRVNRKENENWGKLRTNSAEDVIQSRTDQVSEEYRSRVETYFRVLAERARQSR
ncbi:MAG: hypothetical protein KDA91_16340 [Planctomycetaceae bacterium]|nr:hypothetical protein [Planctomycetaceae bacterium]